MASRKRTEPDRGHKLQYRPLFNIAKCYEKLFRYDKAFEYYARYLEGGGPSASKRIEAEQAIGSLRERLAKLVIESNVAAEMIWFMRALTVAAVMLFVACSLVLQEHEFPECTKHRDCDGLNEVDDIGVDACERWQCDGQRQADGAGLVGGRCVLRPRDDDSDGHVSLELCEGTDADDQDATVYEGAPELCDGKDNDGDVLIDEPTEDGTVVLAPKVETTIDTDGAPLAVSYAARRQRASAVWVTRAGDREDARFVFLDDPETRSDFALQISKGPNDQSFVDPDAEMFTASNCLQWSSALLGSVQQGCVVREASVGFLGNTMLSVVVAELGSTRGQVRLGYARDVDSPGAIMRGPAVRSNSYLGIDIDETGRTTGASRSDRLGATLPVVAPLDGGEVPQALAAWLGDAPDREVCGAVEANVEAVVAYFDERSDAHPIQERRSRRIGRGEGVGSTHGRRVPGACTSHVASRSRVYIAPDAAAVSPMVFARKARAEGALIASRPRPRCDSKPTPTRTRASNGRPSVGGIGIAAMPTRMTMATTLVRALLLAVVVPVALSPIGCGDDEGGAIVLCEPEGSCACGDGQDRSLACTCIGGSTCSVSADEVEFDCEGNAACGLECGDDCLITCPGTTTCTVNVGDGASITCPGTATCEVVCRGDCTVSVAGAARATVACAAESSGARCELVGCNRTDCGDGIHTCRSACP